MLLRREREIARNAFAFALWPDVPEDDALANLRRALHLLQRWLPQDAVWFHTTRRTIRWNTDAPYDFDVQEYEALFQANRLAEAADLYDGDLLEGIDEEWITPERERYREMQCDVLRRLIRQLREDGDTVNAIAAARKALAMDPWHEEFVRAVIELRSRGGDRIGALREYQAFTHALEREMNAVPERQTIELAERIRAADDAEIEPPVAQHGGGTNLPAQMTALFGRDEAIDDLTQLLQQRRLLTIVGAGGIGKTRLGLRLASDVLSRYRDGVWLVEFAPLSAPEFVAGTLAGALNVHESQERSLRDSVIQALKGRHALLVLDNCEHVVDAVAECAADILRSCPNIQIVATSREPLEIEGEQTYRVGPLACPPPDMHVTTEHAMQYSAVALFVERAQSVSHSFRINDENAVAIAEICRRLDGLPLAIELAAARTGVLSPARLNEGLKERFRLLSGGGRTKIPRHRTLRALIDWSYGLLDEREKIVLRRISVFNGGFSLEGAASTASAADELDVLDTLSSLAEKSLLVADTTEGHERYALSESTREYLLEKLDECDEREVCACAHAQYYRRFAQRADLSFHTTSPPQWVREITQEFENINAALLFTIGERNDVPSGADIAACLDRFWFICGRARAGLYWIETALENLDEGAHARTAARLHLAHALLEEGAAKLRAARRACHLYETVNDDRGYGYALRQCALALRQEQPAQAEAACRQAADLLASVSDFGGEAMALNTLGSALARRGEFQAAYDVHSQALALARKHNASYATVHTLLYLADLEFQRGNAELAVERAAEAVRNADATRMANLTANLRCNLGIYRIGTGDWQHASGDIREALEISRSTQNAHQTAIALQHWALIDARSGNYERAARLTGYVDAFFSAAGSREPTETTARLWLEDALQAHLPSAQYDALRAAGASLTEDDARTEALEDARVSA